MAAARDVNVSTGRMEQGDSGVVAVGDAKGVMHAMEAGSRGGIEVEEGCVEKVSETTGEFVDGTDGRESRGCSERCGG